jgi:hypothetical protein
MVLGAGEQDILLARGELEETKVDRGGLEPPTSPSLDFFAKGLDGF